MSSRALRARPFCVVSAQKDKEGKKGAEKKSGSLFRKGGSAPAPEPVEIARRACFVMLASIGAEIGGAGGDVFTLCLSHAGAANAAHHAPRRSRKNARTLNRPTPPPPPPPLPRKPKKRSNSKADDAVDNAASKAKGIFRSMDAGAKDADKAAGKAADDAKKAADNAKKAGKDVKATAGEAKGTVKGAAKDVKRTVDQAVADITGGVKGAAGRAKRGESAFLEGLKDGAPIAVVAVGVLAYYLATQKPWKKLGGGGGKKAGGGGGKKAGGAGGGGKAPAV